MRCLILMRGDFRRVLDENRSIERKVMETLAERLAATVSETRRSDAGAAEQLGQLWCRLRSSTYTGRTVTPRAARRSSSTATILSGGPAESAITSPTTRGGGVHVTEIHSVEQEYALTLTPTVLIVVTSSRSRAV